jgi:hypothetical protein
MDTQRARTQLTSGIIQDVTTDSYLSITLENKDTCACSAWFVPTPRSTTTDSALHCACFRSSSNWRFMSHACTLFSLGEHYRDACNPLFMMPIAWSWAAVAAASMTARLRVRINTSDPHTHSAVRFIVVEGLASCSLSLYGPHGASPPRYFHELILDSRTEIALVTCARGRHLP